MFYFVQSECIKQILEDDKEIMEKLIREMDYLHKWFGEPPIEVLLALKDELQISDDRWHQVIQIL